MGVCFDQEDDGLMGLVRGNRVLEVALTRNQLRRGWEDVEF